MDMLPARNWFVVHSFGYQVLQQQGSKSDDCVRNHVDDGAGGQMGSGIDVQLLLESGKRTSVGSGVFTGFEVDSVVQTLVWVAQG